MKKLTAYLIILCTLLTLLLTSCGDSEDVPDKSGNGTASTVDGITTAPATTEPKDEPQTDLLSSEGLEYKLNETGDGYIVTGIGECKDTDVVIPGEHEGLPVVEVGKDAFEGCDFVTSVTIPDSVTGIGTEAFHGCKALTSVTIPDSVTFISNVAFEGCEALTSIEIPDSVTEINWGAFAGCKALKRITIPDGVTEISPHMFLNCEALTSITIPNSVTEIGEEAFLNCSNLSDVYYTGSQEQWKKIKISDYNGLLTSATIHYNYNR